MVSLTAGLIISTAAFLMARSATSFFQHEAGITSAQYAVMVGMARLQADIKNASFLGSPNIDVDPLLCGDPAVLPASAGAHPGANALAGVHLEADGSFNRETAANQALWALNGLAPDAFTIAGSFDTTEQFSAAQVLPTGGGAYNVVLNFVNDGAAIRTLRRAQEGGATFQDIFRAGRLLRVRDKEGRFGLGVISGAPTVDIPNGRVTIPVAGNPSMGKRETHGNCGCTLWCVGAPVSVIARMFYSLRNVAAFPAYANLAQTAATLGAAGYHRGHPVAVDRTELTRIELDQQGNELPATLQVLAEFAVDLELGASYEDPAPPAGNVPIVLREAVGDTGNVARYVIGGPPGAAGANPDLIRAIQVRLSTRGHRRDRDVGIPAAGDLHPYRFNLGANQGFVRMRTLISEMQLPNQARRITP